MPLDIGQPFKLNADPVGVCAFILDQASGCHPDLFFVLYTPNHLVLIAKEAAREGSILSLSDRLGLVGDAMALSKAGLAKVLWRGENKSFAPRLVVTKRLKL